MIDFAGRSAFITGGASGIGLGFARRIGAAGAKVIIADVEANALAKAESELRDAGIEVLSVECDVSNQQSVLNARDAALNFTDKIHFLFNNAGVGRGGPLEQIELGDWYWVIGVNFQGVVHGLRAFLPHMKAHGEPGHIVNTASMSGMRPVAVAAPYTATKFAVVGLTETLALELEGTALGASVLCPASVRSNMPDSTRNRPAAAGGPLDLREDPRMKRLAELSQTIGMAPDLVADLVLRAIQARRLYVFTHPNERDAMARRFDAILRDVDANAADLAELG